MIKFHQLLTAAVLLVALVTLGVIQWSTGFQGDILWIGIVALSFLLVGTLLLILPDHPSTAENEWDTIAPLPWEEPSWYDSSRPGSPFHREN